MKQVNNCYLTYSTYDVKAFLESHKSYYRVGYNKDLGLWMISDSMIHSQMVTCAQRNGDLEDADKAISRTDHLYYVPEKYTDEKFDIHYIEIHEVVIYDEFTLGRAFYSSVNYFQDFIDIFGKPLEVRKFNRHRKVAKRPNRVLVDPNEISTPIAKEKPRNLFVEQARKWLPLRNI